MVVLLACLQKLHAARSDRTDDPLMSWGEGVHIHACCEVRNDMVVPGTFAMREKHECLHVVLRCAYMLPSDAA